MTLDRVENLTVETVTLELIPMESDKSGLKTGV